MAKYRKVDPRIWNDEKFRRLSDRGQLTFLFLLTHPHLTLLGAMRATVPGLAAELGHWPEKAFREAFGEGCRKGMVKHDEKACLVWLPKFLNYNRPESPNVVKSWPDAWQLIPEYPLQVEIYQQVKGFAEGLTEGYREAWSGIECRLSRYPSGNQEQEQEQEQEVKEEPNGSSSVEPTATTAANGFWFPMIGGKQWDLPPKKRDEYESTFGDRLDVAAELRKAKQWLTDNSDRRPRAGKGMASFLTRWLNRSYDKSPKGRGKTPELQPGEELALSVETGEYYVKPKPKD